MSSPSRSTRVGQAAQLMTRAEHVQDEYGNATGWHRLDATLTVLDGNLLLRLRVVGTVRGGNEEVHRQYDQYLLQAARATIANLRR